MGNLASEPIALDALISKITSTIDGGWRISIDVPESSNEEIKQLIDLKGQAVKVVIMMEGI